MLVWMNDTTLRVAKPGFDARTAAPINLLFSSEFRSPRLITKGIFVSSPIDNGLQETVSVIGFGTSYTPLPVVAAIATCGQWATGAQNIQTLSYLNGQWHTFVYEQPAISLATAVYDGVARRRGVAPVPPNFPLTFASARFVYRLYSNRVEFVTNCRNAVVVRYAVLYPHDS